MYKFNEKLYEKPTKPSITSFVLILGLAIAISIMFPTIKDSTGDDRTLRIAAIVMWGSFLIKIILDFFIPRKFSFLSKRRLESEIDKLISQGKNLEALILDNSIEFRGMMYVAVYKNGGNYIRNAFSEVIVNFNEINELRIVKDTVVLGYKQRCSKRKFTISNYFENSKEFAYELKEKLIQKKVPVRFNF